MKKPLNWEDLPPVVTPEMLRRTILKGCLGRNTLYRLLKQPGAPVFRAGRRFLISRDAFRSWIEKGGDDGQK
jgi:excisionase family DNA binding protein